MAVSPEKSHNDQFSAAEERELTQEWYGNTSFEGRTTAQFEALRDDVQKSTILDFARFHADRDYRRLIYENPFVGEFLTKCTVTDLWTIYEERNSIGLSEERFKKLVTSLGPEVAREWRLEVEMDGELTRAMQEKSRQFTAPELTTHRREIAKSMRKQIELQHQGIPHEAEPLPLFPPDKEPQ